MVNEHFWEIFWNSVEKPGRETTSKSLHKIDFMKSTRDLVSQENSKIFHRSIIWPSYNIVLNYQVFLKKCGMPIVH